MKSVVFHPQAENEYLESLKYYARVDTEIAFRFDEEVQRLVREIARDPKRFFHFHPLAQWARSRRFPYSVVYVEQSDRIWVIAVMHAKRKPEYWVDRIQI